MYTTRIQTTLRKLSDPSAFGGRVVEAGWLTTIVVVALYFGLYTSHQFDPDKVLLLRSIVLVMLVAEVWWQTAGDATAVDNWRQRLRRWRERNPILIPLVVYLAVCAIATAASIAPSVSFFGFNERLDGLYTTLTYGAFFLLLAARLKTSEQVTRLITTMLMTSVPIALYAVVQHYGLDPIVWNIGGQSRVLSTMGNPIFLSGYVLMVVPFTLARLVSAVTLSRDETADDEGDWLVPLLSWLVVVIAQNVVLGLLVIFSDTVAGVWWLAPGACALIILLAAMVAPAPRSRAFARCEAAGLGVLLALQLAAIVLTQSRGPLLGLLAACAVFGIAVVRAKGGRAFKAALVSLAVAAVFLIVLSSSGYGGRLGKLTDLSGSSEVRTTIWKASLHLLQSRPPIGLEPDRLGGLRYVIGYGPETLQLALNPVSTARLQQLEGSVAPDRNHNELLDRLMMTGAAGLVAYVVLVLAGLRLGWRLLVEKRPFDEHVLAAAALGAIVGHVVETQTGIATAATTTYFFVSLGLLVALCGKHDVEASTAPVRASWQQPWLVVLLFVIAGALLESMVAARVVSNLRAIVFLSVGWLLAGLWSWAAMSGRVTTARPVKPVSWVIRGVAVVVAIVSIAANLDAMAAGVYSKQGAQLEGQQAFAASVDAYTQAAYLQPGEPSHLVGLGRSYLDLANTATDQATRIGFLKASEAALQHALELQPLDPNHHSNLGRLYKIWGETIDRTKLTLAERDLSDAVRVRPGIAQSHDELASVLFLEGRMDDAVAQARTAQTLDDRDAASRIFLGDRLLQQGNGDVAVDEYSEALALDAASLSDSSLEWRINTLVQLHKAERLVEPYRVAMTHSASAPVLKASAYLADRLDRPADAVELYRAVLRSNPREWVTARYLAEDQQKLGRIDDAIATLQQALPYAPAGQAEFLRQPLQQLLDQKKAQ